jgi:CDP-diacylglycerol--glycerol-3-phosphate 3-phosphatidyltransferase
MVNGITLYRILAVPLLIWLLVRHEWEPFRWLLILSFLTDAVDGYLARRFQVISKAGAILDSIGDDLTVAVAIAGLLAYRPAFLREQWLPVLCLFVLYVVQAAAALIRYRKLTSFHTWLAKTAAVLQALFLLLVFFLPQVPMLLFWVAAAGTGLDLIEETAMVFLLPHWQADVRGVFALRRKKGTAHR